MSAVADTRARSSRPSAAKRRRGGLNTWSRRSCPPPPRPPRRREDARRPKLASGLPSSRTALSSGSAATFRLINVGVDPSSQLNSRRPHVLLWNRYVYVGNDPVNFIDPTGLSWWSKFKCAVGKTVGMIPDLFSGAHGNLGAVTNYEAAIGAGLLAYAYWSFIVLQSGVVAPLAAGFAGTLLVADALRRAWASCDK